MAHHPIRGKKDYDAYVGRAALVEKGKKIWNKRVARVLGVLRTVVNFDHLYIGGGNAKQIAFELPPDISIIPNTDGLIGGIALWRAEESAGHNDSAAPHPPEPERAAPKRPTPKRPTPKRPTPKRPARAAGRAAC